ncbi:ATP12 family chaperone protein [Aquicoccus sp. G2-2]|uniref:ATP12 family chaperone protein n=1 Tax=Aquicoccus sp. G2-2 TaxID=3092120 RepID=UPI002ADF7FD7|nr:ATP12 family protein [Aquicoccus sp. G2-2]MEA1113762.1 ATP12 family protein [Aquicoccus sp. G2-2]
MSERKLKRFWTAAATAPEGDGFAVHLDGRPLRTPAKQPLILPTDALARAVAEEWDAQVKVVDPTTMPLTRGANAAIDKVSVQHADVASLLADYGDSDLLCYRATEPKELVARQAAGWDPLLTWARDAQDIDLKVFSGVIHQPQSAAARATIAAKAHALDAFALAAFHDLVSLSGSFIIGLAAIEGQSDPQTLWALSRIDETWQEGQWGIDEEAAQLAARKREDFLQAVRFHALSRG